MRYTKLYSVLICLFLLTLVFSGCSLFSGPSAENLEPGLRIYIDSFPDAARTYSPDFSTKPDFQEYSINLRGQGTTTTTYNYSVTGDSRNNPQLIKVVYGTYIITVRGYLTTKDSDYSAIGTVTHTYDATPAGQTAVIVLGPVIGEGAGTLSYSIAPGKSIAITPYFYEAPPEPDPPPEGEEAPEPEPPEWPLTLSGTDSTSLPSDYYQVVYDDDRPPEILHIYKNFETILNVP